MADARAARAPGHVPSNPYGLCARQALQDLRRFREGSRRRAQLREPVALSDALLSTLEDRLVAGHKRVPAELQAELDTLVATLPDDLRRELRTGVKLERAMDDLFTLQDELLLRLSAPPLPRAP